MLFRPALLGSVLLGSVLFGCSLLLAAPARAHDVLIGTDPADGARLSAAPAAIVLTFAEQALRTGTRVQVTGPDGAPVAAAPVQVVGSTVTQPLDTGLPAGGYTVLWRVTSADGHPVSGRLAFTVAGVASGASAASPAASPAPTEPGAPGGSLGWVAGGVLVVLAGVGGLMWRLVRRPVAPATVTGR